MFRRTHRKVLLLVVLTTLGTSTVFVWFQRSEVRRAELVAQERRAARELLVERVISLGSALPQTMTFDYSYWDEMVDFVHAPDVGWAKENIDIGLGTYKADVAWILRTDYSILYRGCAAEGCPYGAPPWPAAAWPRIFGKGWFPHFFAEAGNGLLEVWGGPIQPSADNERKTPPHGFLVVGRLWSDDVVQSFADLAQAQVRLVAPAANGRPPPVESGDLGTVSFAEPLADWNDVPVRWLAVRSESETARTLAERSDEEFLLLVGAFALTVLVVVLALQFWVTRPLGMLTRSLEQESPAPLEPLLRNRTEFGTLAGRLVQYFEQKVELVREVAVRRQLAERLEHMAHHDALTGVPNRTLLQDRLVQALARARRGNNVLAVLMIDLDGFKAVNDQLGHDAGDELLREAACRLADLLRKGDTVARVGGDEFVVVAPDLGTVTDAARVAHRVLTEVGRPYHIRGRDVTVGASIGLALFPLDGDQTDVLLGKADAAMYRVKGRTRNDYEFYTRSLSITGEERSAMEAELRRAIAESELSVRYVPHVDLSTFRVCGGQAVAFWPHRTKGLLPPHKFAALAEETGHLGALCELTLRAACADTAGRLKAAAGIDRIAVRLAPAMLRRPDLGDWLLSVLRAAAVDPRRIELEVPEAALAVNPEIGLRALQAVRALGMPISISEFGAGASPLTSPGRFGADGMKIASAFTDDVAVNPEHRAIIAAMLALARNLGERRVVVGGITSEEQLAALRALGCGIGEGPLLSPAVLPDRMAELAAKGPVR